MPVYTLNTPSSSRNQWAEGLKSLADAFAPDPRMALGMAEIGLKREQLDFEMGMERDKFGLLQNESAAQIEQMQAAAAQARANGDLAAERIITEGIQQKLYEAQAGKATAETGEITAQTEAGDRMVEMATNPEAYSPTEMFATSLRGDKTDMSLADAIVASSPDGEMPPNFEPALQARGTSFQNTETGAREGWAQELLRKQAEPVTVTQDSNVFLAPDDPRRLSPDNPLLPGQTSVADTEQVVPVNVPGAPERPTITGPNFREDPAKVPSFDNYTWTQDGVRHTTLGRVMPDGSVRDREGNELPFNAVVIAKPQVTGGNVDSMKLTEAEGRVADLTPQIVAGVQDINKLVGYDTATDSFPQGGEFPGARSVFANLFGAGVGSVFGKDLGAYAGNVTRGDFANDFEYQMFRVSEPLLRFRSGAATPEEEVQRYKMYGPQAGLSDAQNEGRIRDLNRLASAMAYVAQRRGIPVMDVVGYTSILPGAGIMDPEMRMEVERALAAGNKPAEAAPEVPAAPAVPGAPTIEFEFD